MPISRWSEHDDLRAAVLDPHGLTACNAPMQRAWSAFNGLIAATIMSRPATSGLMALLLVALGHKAALNV